MCGTSSQRKRTRRSWLQDGGETKSEPRFRLLRKCGSSGHTAAMLGASSPLGVLVLAEFSGLLLATLEEKVKFDGTRALARAVRANMKEKESSNMFVFIWFYFLLSSSLIISLDPSYEKLIDRLQSVVRVFFVEFRSSNSTEIRTPLSKEPRWI